MTKRVPAAVLKRRQPSPSPPLASLLGWFVGDMAVSRSSVSSGSAGVTSDFGVLETVLSDGV